MEPVEIDFIIGGNTETEGKKVEKSLDDITAATKKAQADVVAAAKEQASVIKQIESDIKSLEKEISKAAPGNSQQALVQELGSAKRALAEEKAALNDVNASIEKTASGHVRLRTQVMEAKDALAKMEMAGLRGTAEYKAQAQVLGELNDQMGDTSAQAKILADDEKGFKGVASAVSGVAGAMSAGVGAAALFGAENEDLAKIQTRLQAVMAITIGIQQVAETLNKDSYFSVVMLTRAKEMWSVANLKVATTLGVSTAAAQAFLFTITGGLIVALIAVTAAVSIFISKQQEQKKAAEETAKAQQEASKKTAEDYGKEISKMEAMRASLDSENISRNKKLGIIKQLKEIIPGYTAELDKEGNVIRENKKAIEEYMISIDKSMRIRASEAKLSELYAKAYSIESSPEFQRQKEIESGANKVVNQIRASKGQAPIEAFKVTTPELDKIYEEIDNAKKYISNNNLVEFIKPDKVKADKAEKEVYDAEKALGDMILEINAQTSKLLLDQQVDSLQKRLNAIDLEKQQEVQKIQEKEVAIIEAYNKAHKDDKGNKPLASSADAYNEAHKNDKGFVPKTNAEVITSSLATIDTSKDKELTKKRGDELLALDAAYAAKRVDATKVWGEELTALALQFADERLQIAEKYNKDIVKLAGNPEAIAAATAERDNRVSEVTAGLIEETEAYKLANDEKIDLGKSLNDKLINQIKERVAAEIKANKLSPEAGAKILAAVEKSQAGKVSGSLDDLIASYGKLKKAKADLETAKKNGDVPAIIKATEAVSNYTTATETSFSKLEKGFSQASFYANQAVGLLNAISTEEGDAASSAAKSIGAVMDIAGSTMEGFKQGGYIGAGIALATSVATKIFESEKAHQAALKKLQDEKNAQQKEYNDLLMKQNELLKNAETVFGSDAYSRALGMARVADKIGDALYSKESKVVQTRGTGIFAKLIPEVREYKGAIEALNDAKVQTGSHKTGLFGWGGEKADYSSLLATYPRLIDGQGKLNQELAQSVLNNQTLTESSKTALQSALDYSKDYDDALKSLSDYLTTVFGSLGSDMMTAITQNLNDTQSAIDKFGESAAKSIEKLMTDIAYSMFLADNFTKLSNDVKAVLADGSLTPEQQAAKDIQLLGDFYKSVGADIKNADKFLSDSKDAAAKAGFKLWDTAAAQQTGIKGDVAKMTEETGSALTGQVTALRLNVAAILAVHKSSGDIMSKQLATLEDIKTNTSFCKRLDRIDETLYYLKLNGIKVQ